MSKPASDKAERRKAAEREALVDRLCSCIECGTIARASSVSWIDDLYCLHPDDREKLLDVVGLAWELRQGYGSSGIHGWGCPPCIPGKLVEVEEASCES